MVMMMTEVSEMNWVFPGDVKRIATQIGSDLMPDNKVWFNRFTVKSKTSKSGRVYTVAQRRTDGVWGCSCPGWTHHRKCKHLKDILSRLAALSPQQPAASTNVLDMLASARAAHQELNG